MALPRAKKSNSVGITLPRVRTVSLNCFTGGISNAPGVTIFRRLGQITQLSPSDALAFVEERIDTINDAWFAMQWDFSENRPDEWGLRDKPAIEHQRGSNFAYADGHADIHRWKDARTVSAPRDDAPMPGNHDVLWLQTRSTWREQ